MAFTEELFDPGLDNKMAGGPTLGLFKNPDGTYVDGSGVVPPNDSPNAVASVATGAATVHLSSQAGTGSDPATITMLNTVITAVNAALTILDANTVKANTNGGAINVLNDWLIQSGSIKPPVS